MCAQIVSLITGFLTLAFRKLAAGNDTIRLQTTPLRWSSNINSIPFNQYAVLVHIVCSAAAPFFYFIHFQTQWRAFQVFLDFLPKFVLVWLFLDNKNINHLCSDENSRTLRNYRKGSQFQNSWKYRLQTVFQTKWSVAGVKKKWNSFRARVKEKSVKRTGNHLMQAIEVAQVASDSIQTRIQIPSFISTTNWF
jgi:hypothetical protein